MGKTRAKFQVRCRLWATTACLMLILLAVCVQAVHVHAQGESSGATCLACVSAHTGVPVRAILSAVHLIAITSVLVLYELEIPSYEAFLPLFIRPPPSR